MEPGGIDRPIRIGGRVPRGGAHQDFLHIAPAEVGIGLQHQSNDPADHGSGGGSAAEIFRVILVGKIGRRLVGIVSRGTDQIRRRDAWPIQIDRRRTEGDAGAGRAVKGLQP